METCIRIFDILIPEYCHNSTLVRTTLDSDYSETKLSDNGSMFQVFTLESELKAVAKMDLNEDYFKAKPSLGHIYLFDKVWLYTEYWRLKLNTVPYTGFRHKL